jgi:nicotinamide mononucleotide transporter
MCAILYIIICKSYILDTFVLLTGVLCVALVAQGNIWNYPIGAINTIAYAYVAYQNKLFGEALLFMFFYFPTNIVGYFLWKKKITQNIVISKSLSTKNKLIIAISLAITTVLVGFVLKSIPEQNNPYIDAFITTLSVAATLLMIKRYSEQWILYIILNCFCVLLWTIRHINGSESALSMIGMWSIFLVNACYGYYSWTKKLSKENCK